MNSRRNGDLMSDSTEANIQRKLRDGATSGKIDEKQAAIIIQRTVRHWLKNCQ